MTPIARQQLLRNRLRSLLQLARQLKRSRHGDLAERGLLGLLGLRPAVSIPYNNSIREADRLRDPLFQNMKHEQPV